MNRIIQPGDLKPHEPQDRVIGSIERVTFHNAETGFCVLKVHVAGKRDLLPVVGHAPALAAGERIERNILDWLTHRGEVTRRSRVAALNETARQNRIAKTEFTGRTS